MSGLGMAIAVSGWIFAGALLVLLPARLRRQTLQSVLRLRVHAIPYLQRQAAAAGLRISPPAGLPQRADDVLSDLCALAAQLVEQEQAVAATADTVELAMSDTQRVASRD